MIEDIQVDKLTHVAYAYIRINGDDGSVDVVDKENCENSQRKLLYLPNKTGYQSDANFRISTVSPPKK